MVTALQQHLIKKTLFWFFFNSLKWFYELWHSLEIKKRKNVIFAVNKLISRILNGNYHQSLFQLSENESMLENIYNRANRTPSRPVARLFSHFTINPLVKCIN